MNSRSLVALGLLWIAGCRPAAAPRPTPTPVIPIDPCIEARARATAEPDLQVDRVPAPLAMKPAAFQRVPRRVLRPDGSAEVRVDVVIDTAGRADMRTFKVIAASHPWFVANVRTVLPKWRFTPASLSGCLVPRLYHLSATTPPRPAATRPRSR